MRATLIKLCSCLGLLLIAFSSLAAIEVHEFDNDVDRKRYQSFVEEMRCPKCQNQNLAGTNSAIAMDLRRELVFMIKEGKSDKEIVDFMVERYGEFILYRPRLNSSTLLLWGAPVFLLIAGIILLLVIVRKRRTLDLASGESGLSAEEQARLTDLLNNTQDSTSHTNKQEKQ
ncbi:cytochrome c-type biogenesis protein CcmH [Cellvibrio mixtus]|uniref:Cytochrome c-type biogenesis protein n=1 Tax=Cellvibrio mixtus TaxID=39650 RepID=A0A266Q5J1_9GAMM|nr:cytochrome c-type biogenesis protein [Cellvibrio mixtus]OZY85102.1 cytochrome c-type biogenesis protein CcmH [Cellvibrio mixtus]